MYGTALTFVIAFGGTMAALYRPYVGFLGYVCLGMLCPEDLWAHALPAFNYSRIIGIGMIVGWVIKGFGDWQLGRARGVVLALLGFYGWSCLSAAAAPDQAVAWGFIDSLTKIVLPFLVGITTLTSTAQLKQLAWV